MKKRYLCPLGKDAIDECFIGSQFVPDPAVAVSLSLSAVDDFGMARIVPVGDVRKS